MASINVAALVNLLGWAIGFALYAMLLALAAKSLRPLVGAWRTAAARRGIDFLPFATALLGLLWNAGALATQGLHELGYAAAPQRFITLLGAASLSALGFLPAVVVHSALSDSVADTSQARGRRAWLLLLGAYLLSTFAGLMHFRQALFAGEASSNVALQILTIGFVLLMLGMASLTRKETGWQRAVSATALAVFAVSALHLSSGINYGTHTHGSHDRWYGELIGHHASLPLALAILYQDYRFAFADIFLKRALALLAFVVLVAAAFAFYTTVLLPLAAMTGVPAAGDVQAYDARAVSLLLALWVGTGLLYPQLRAITNKFVETVVLRRIDSSVWRAELARVVQIHESVFPLLDEVCDRLGESLTAAQVRWHETHSPAGSEDESQQTGAPVGRLGEPGAEELVVLPSRQTGDDATRGHSSTPHPSVRLLIPTSEAPRYEILVGDLAGGRRVLSDDIALLEATAITVARRIDALRVTHERCEQVQREQEIAKLASEAQLRALRAQINPHFLFNALTTIGYLIQTSPPRAFETLLRLTDLLRRVLRATAEWTTLGEELKLIEAYLDIERARFEERLRVCMDVPPELRDLLVPSLVVQPLVENAIKHGIAPSRAGGEVQITARIGDANGEEMASDAPLLVITIRDTGVGASDAQLIQGRRTGVGLANVEQRLGLCCGTAGKLSIETQPGAGAKVELFLPVRTGSTKKEALFTNESQRSNTADDFATVQAGEGTPALHTTSMREGSAK